MSNLLIFTCPKETGRFAHIDRIQANALWSWQQLPGDPEIILFDENLRQTWGASGHNVYGTPLVNAIFGYAADHFPEIPFHMYTNADIIYRADIVNAFKLAKAKFDKFLMVGRRWDIDITFDIRANDVLELAYQMPMTWHQAAGMDYFVYPAGAFDFSTWPAFALGRFRWDNWIAWHALHCNVPLIDASLFVKPLHQNHDYAHFVKEANVELAINEKLARDSGCNKWCTADDANFVMESDGTIHERKHP